MKAKPSARGQKLALLCAEALSAKKGMDIAVLDMRGISEIADFFVLATGGSANQLRAMSEEVEARVHGKTGAKPLHTEGLRECRWVVVDYVDVVVHLFTETTRKYYNLDRLWGDAKVVHHEGP